MILVIGGAGYIGSHMAAALLESGYPVVVFDNLSTGHRGQVPEDAVFVEGDLRNPVNIRDLFKSYPVSVVIHMAASSQVGESVTAPLKYYQNNVAACIHLLEQMSAFRIPHLIFSSTAAVYGNSADIPLTEDSQTQPINPYGHSKLMIEQIIRDAAAAHLFSYVVLRYFNAAGAHEEKNLGEMHEPESHLIPNLLASLNGQGQILTVYGNDYETPDGTCVRDFIHVQDLCDAHVRAVRHLQNGGASETFNLGSEQGFSVGEVIQRAQSITGREARVTIGPRRAGDPAVLIASSEKARRILGWAPQRNLDAILQTAWKWHERVQKNEIKAAA